MKSKSKRYTNKKYIKNKISYINMFYNKIFSKNPDDLCKNIDKLPYEMVDIIYSYIPKNVTIFLTKEQYVNEHQLIRKYIPNREIENYIRAMLRQDNDFVFKQLLKENQERWLNMKRYYYKNCIHLNYIIFLESYAIDNESTKCRNLIGELLEELGLSKNQHKKNTIKYIRWKT
jgi:hypothetical protein